MDYQTGRLTEISPFGTGFVEDRNGARYGFHYSMIRDLKAAVPSNWQTLLSDQVVQFKESRGIVTEVLLQGAGLTASVVSSRDPKKAATA
jgi:hypothetical protein